MRTLTVLIPALLLASLPGVAPSTAAPGPATFVKHGYVVKSVVLPANSAQVQVLSADVDGDGEPDNKLGQMFALLADQGIDFQPGIAAAITSGSLVTLLSVQTTSLKNAKTAKVRLFKGKPKANPDLDGGGTFRVDAAAPRAELKAKIVARKIITTKGTVPITLPGLYTGLPFIKLVLRAGQITAECTTNRCTKGVISGGISKQQVSQRIIPAIGAMARAYLAADCATTPPDPCPSGSTGEKMLQLFDTNDDLTITDQEIRDNSLVGSILALDLDLNRDGIKDALSIGFGFAAVSADVRGD